MNIIRMTGGMGNQMFQYALYLKLVSQGKKIKFDDINEYKLANARPIMLWAFGIDYPRASEEEIAEITDGFMHFHDRVRRKLFGRKSLEYHEKDCNFDPFVLEKEPAYLTGYFQSEQYFKDIEKQVREAFTFQPIIYENQSENLKEYILACEKLIRNTCGVSLHIRRGDYLTSSEVYGGNCTPEYYKKAISLMDETCHGAVFYVFSNDAAWTKQWLAENYPGRVKKAEEAVKCSKEQVQDALVGNFVVMQGIPEELGYLDMMLMSRCKHHIIANSSFSWWGAYLNASEDKKVIAPARWFNNQDCLDIYTKEMIKVTSDGRKL